MNKPRFPKWVSLGFLLVVDVLVIVLLSEAALRLIPSRFREFLERERYLTERMVMQSLFCESDSDPLIAWHNIPNANGRFENREFSTRIRFDSLGLRGPDLAISSPNSSRRVLVLGDSFTVGWGVEEQDTFVHLLNNVFPQWDFLNLGVSGYGTHNEWGLLQKLGGLLQAKQVILVFYGNDPQESYFQSPSFRHQPKKIRGLSNLYVVEFRKKMQFRPTENSLPNYRNEDIPMWASCATYLDYIRNWCRSRGVQLHVVDIPYKDELTKPGSRGYHLFLAAYCRTHGIPLLDLKPLLQRNENRVGSYFRIDEHLTPYGHTLVADAIKQHLEPYLN